MNILVEAHSLSGIVVALIDFNKWMDSILQYKFTLYMLNKYIFVFALVVISGLRNITSEEIHCEVKWANLSFVDKIMATDDPASQNSWRISRHDIYLILVQYFVASTGSV